MYACGKEEEGQGSLAMGGGGEEGVVCVALPTGLMWMEEIMCPLRQAVEKEQVVFLPGWKDLYAPPHPAGLPPMWRGLELKHVEKLRYLKGKRGCFLPV